MLQEISVKNFTIIDEIRVSFENGLNIITGETGAGKSIVIDAISLILGKRSSNDYIKKGKEKANIEGVFLINNNFLKEELDNLGIDYDDDLLIIEREITKVKSLCRINGKTVTISIIKKIAKFLIDMHGQHEHQSILDEKKHVELLDSIGGIEIKNLKDSYVKIYNEYKYLSTNIYNMTNEIKKREEKLEYINYQIKEIKTADLKVDEDKSLIEEKNILSNSEKLYNNTSKVYEIMYNGEQNNLSIYDKISSVVSYLEEISNIDINLGEIYKNAEDIKYQIEDITESIRIYKDNIEFDPERLVEIEERLDIINELKRKYNLSSIKEIFEYLNTSLNEKNSINSLKEQVSKYQEKINKLTDDMIKIAKELSEKRMSVAKKLEKDIEKELAQLNMPKTKFRINMYSIEDEHGILIEGKKIKIDYNGLDKVRFLISTNPGEPLKPLERIISGGEMSRIMLALKTIFAKHDKIKTMIFDEIDTGIGGRAAQAVAEKMSIISKSHQIICVTHSPQIASMADTHFYIEKKSSNDTTKTIVKKLNSEDKVIEISRMIGGAKLTELTLDHAQEMINIAKKQKHINN